MTHQPNKLHVTLCIVITFFSTGVLNATQGYMLPHYIENYPQLTLRPGWMGSIQSIGSVIALILTAFFFRKDTSKILLYRISLTLMVIFCLIMCLKPSLGFALTAYALFGCALAWQSSTTSSITSDIRENNKVTPYLGLLHGAFGIGGLAAPMIFLTLESASIGWSQTFLLLFFILSIIAVVVLFSLRNYNETWIQSKPKLLNKEPEIFEIKRFLFRRTNILMLFCAFMYAAHQICISLWVKQYMMLQYFDRYYAALALSLFWVGTAIARIGQLVIRIPPERQLAAGNLCASVFLTIGLFLHSPVYMVLCTLGAGLSAGGSIPILLSLSTKNNTDNALLATSILLFIIFFSQFSFPIIIDMLTIRFTFRVSIVLAIITAAICSFFAIHLRMSSLKSSKEI